MPSISNFRIKSALFVLVALGIALLLFSTSMIPGHAAGTGYSNSTFGKLAPVVTPINNCGHWKTVKTTNVASLNNYLNSAAVFTTNGIVQLVWGVGYYIDSNSHAQTLIEKRKGTTWTVIPSPGPGTNNILTGAIVSSLKSAVAVGYSYTTDPTADASTLIEQWDGTSWTVVASPNPGSTNTLNAIAQIPGSSAILAVGSSSLGTLIVEWSGGSWVTLPSPNPSGTSITLNGLYVDSATSAWAVGSYVNGSGNAQTLIERWNGSTWSIVSSPNAAGTTTSVLNGVAKINSTNNLLAVGYSTTINQDNSVSYTTLIEQWNGSSWNVVSSPNVGNSALFAIASANSSDLWTVGYGTNGSGITQTLVLHFDTTSSSWLVFSSPNIGTGNNTLRGMGKVFGNDAYFAVGNYYNTSSNLNQTLVESYCR